MLKRSVWLIILLIGLLLVACGSGDQDGIVMEDAWGRPSPAPASNSAFYLTIKNDGQEEDSLVAASVDICGATELHMSSMDEAGVMSMQQMQKIDLPAGETITLEPGGLHIMCLDRQADISPGERVPISLSFAQAGELTVEAEIREQ